MSLICALGGHEAGPKEVYNCGYYFSHCRRCGENMIRAGGSWDMVPEGHRVVWKAGRHNHSVEPDFNHVLPVLHPSANLPMVRPRFMSWSRQVASRKARKGHARSYAPAMPADEREETGYPALLVIAAVVTAGLQLFLGLGGRQGGLG